MSKIIQARKWSMCIQPGCNCVDVNRKCAHRVFVVLGRFSLVHIRDTEPMTDEVREITVGVENLPSLIALLERAREAAALIERTP